MCCFRQRAVFARRVVAALSGAPSFRSSGDCSSRTGELAYRRTALCSVTAAYNPHRRCSAMLSKCFFWRIFGQCLDRLECKPALPDRLHTFRSPAQSSFGKTVRHTICHTGYALHMIHCGTVVNKLYAVKKNCCCCWNERTLANSETLFSSSGGRGQWTSAFFRWRRHSALAHTEDNQCRLLRTKQTVGRFMIWRRTLFLNYSNFTSCFLTKKNLGAYIAGARGRSLCLPIIS